MPSSPSVADQLRMELAELDGLVAEVKARADSDPEDREMRAAARLATRRLDSFKQRAAVLGVTTGEEQ